MRNTLKPIVFGVVAAGAIGAAAFADGVEQLYDANQGYLGEIEIVGDVSIPNGGTFAMWEFADQDLRLFVDPDGVYIMMEEDNPVFTQRIPFDGFWVSTQAGGQACEFPIEDSLGNIYPVHGALKWTNYGIAENGYQILFEIERGYCDGIVENWAYSAARIGLADGVPHGDIDMGGLPTLDEARETCGNEDDLTLRAIGCSDMISHPEIGTQDLSWAFWSRAYVRCGRAAPDEDIVADLMSMVRLDVADGQDYFQRAGGYTGPIDGRVSTELYDAVVRYVEGGCR